MTVAEMRYHFGELRRWYPSQKQKNIFKVNHYGSRAWYNHLIANKRKLGWIIHTPFWNGDLKRKVIENYKKTLKISEEKLRVSWLRDKYLDSLMFAKTNQSNALAYKNYWHGLQGKPKFHKKSNHPYTWKYQTACVHWKTKHGIKSNIYFKDNRHIVTPKMGVIFLGKERTIRNNYQIGTVTYIKTPDDKYWIALQLASNTPFKKFATRTNKAIGIDLNICNFLMDSNGHQVANPKFYTQELPHLKKLEQRMSRRGRFAKHHHISFVVDKGYQRARKRYARFHAYIKNERRCFLDRISTRLIKNHDLIVAENLKSSNILRNHCLAQKASDCGWREFLSMLQYKAKLYGKTVILVNPAYTTQKCSHCGFVCTRSNGYHLTLKDRSWTCPKCHRYHVRDQNAAANILRRGQKMILVKRRENLILLKRKRTPQVFDSAPNLELDFHRKPD